MPPAAHRIKLSTHGGPSLSPPLLQGRRGHRGGARGPTSGEQGAPPREQRAAGPPEAGAEDEETDKGKSEHRQLPGAKVWEAKTGRPGECAQWGRGHHWGAAGGGRGRGFCHGRRDGEGVAGTQRPAMLGTPILKYEGPSQAAQGFSRVLRDIDVHHFLSLETSSVLQDLPKYTRSIFGTV